VRGYARSAELERELRSSVQQSLNELEHRVRNNLQVVSSIVNIRSADPRDPTGALENIRSGIGAISRTHRLLYRTTGDHLVSIDEVLRSTVGWFESGYPRVTFVYQPPVTGCRVDGDFAVSLTIMLNELLSNAVKHGTGPGGDHRVSIEASYDEDDALLTLRVSDGGRGLPPETDGMGLQIISAIAGELHARITVESAPGASYQFQAPLDASPALRAGDGARLSP